MGGARPADTDHSLALPFAHVNEPGAPPGRVAAVLHLYYAELASELRRYLANVPGSVDVFISTGDVAKKAAVEAAFAHWKAGSLEVRVVENRGRDIAPKLIAFREIYDGYDLVLYLHSKRSDHTPQLAHWRQYLVETLVGTPQVAASVYAIFNAEPKIGIIAAQHFEPMRQWVGWGENFSRASALAARMGFGIFADRIDFPAGSMFWLRSAALRPLLDLGLTLDDFDAERGQIDGTLAHTIEHLFFCVCEAAGFRWVKIARPEFLVATPGITWIGEQSDLKRYLSRDTRRLSERGSFEKPPASHRLGLLAKIFSRRWFSRSPAD